MLTKEFIKNIFFNLKPFFLENLGTKQTIFKNTFWLAFAEGVSRFLKLILIIYVARIFGATDYGKFNFALAFIGLFAFFSDLGISSILTREISRENYREKEFSAILTLKIFLSLFTLILILIGSFFITSDLQVQKIIWILALFSLFEGILGTIFAFFQAKQKMEYQAWTKILEAILVTTFGFFVIFRFPSIENLSYAYLFSAILAFIFIISFFYFKVFPIKLSFNFSLWKSYLSLSWPLALTSIFATIYSQIDSVMMGYWKQITQVGWYNAAYKIIGATFIPTVIITTSFYPVLSKFFRDSKEKLQTVWDYFMNSMIFLAIPIIIGGIALSPRIIDFIYDPTYFPTGKEAILAFQILLIMVGFMFLSNPFGQILVVANQQKKFFFITLAGAIINVILNLILIPKYSLYGAAATTVATSALIFFLLFKFTSKFTPVRPFDFQSLASFFSAILASISMYFVVIQPQIYYLNIFLSILIGAAIYFIFFFIFRILINQIFFYERRN